MYTPYELLAFPPTLWMRTIYTTSTYVSVGFSGRDRRPS